MEIKLRGYYEDNELKKKGINALKKPKACPE